VGFASFKGILLSILEKQNVPIIVN